MRHSPAPAGEWWTSYFDAQYLLEYEPLFTLERDRHEVTRLIDNNMQRRSSHRSTAMRSSSSEEFVRNSGLSTKKSAQTERTSV